MLVVCLWLLQCWWSVSEANHYSDDKLNESPASDSITEGDNGVITEGDNVVITVGVSKLQELQKSRSGWAAGMAEVCMLQLYLSVSWPLSLFSLFVGLSVDGSVSVCLLVCPSVGRFALPILFPCVSA